MVEGHYTAEVHRDTANTRTIPENTLFDLRAEYSFTHLSQQARNRPLVTEHRTVFPFSAIIGQEDLKQSLLLNAVNPRIGGVLVRGEKGTAKSTAVRALAALLPEIQVVRGCGFGCDPDLADAACDDCRLKGSGLKTKSRRVRVVNLPLNATEDRVAGGIDFSMAVQQGRRALQPGLLAAAHRGILYVDEVNLLDDHIVDIILDASASGENIIEREGISFRHPARFILVGTMNPEEGELRPQLFDRFGLCVETSGAEDPDQPKSPTAPRPKQRGTYFRDRRHLQGQAPVYE